MSIASQITAYSNGLADAYDAVAGRGGTIPQRRNLVNLPTAINTIPSGGGSGGIPRAVSNNGEYQSDGAGVTAFSLPNNATSVGSFGMYGAFWENTELVTFDGSSVEYLGGTAANRGISAFCYAFSYCTSLTSVDFSSLEEIKYLSIESFAQACMGCTSLVSADFSSLRTIWGDSYSSGSKNLYRLFYGCTSLPRVSFPSLTVAPNNCCYQICYDCSSLTTVDFSSLERVGGNCFYEGFYRCTNLTSVDFSSLVSTSWSTSNRDRTFYRAFSHCTSLQTVSFDSLSIMDGQAIFQEAFTNCTSLTTLSFPALTTTSFGNRTDQFNNMLLQCSNVTVHFPAAIQPTIGSWASVQNGFGGTNTTVLFDL